MFRISFNFNEKTKTVSNLIVEECNNSKELETVFTVPDTSKVGEVEEIKPKKSTRKKKEVNEDVIKLEENKLVLTQKLVDLLELNIGDRVSVRFKEINGVYHPCIACSSIFGDPESGNKLTKSLTVSYRGKQREELAIYGNEFTFEESSPGSCMCILSGRTNVSSVVITPDNKVFKSNKDLETYDDDNEVTESKVTSFIENNSPTKRTYTSNLPKSTDIVDDDLISISDFGLEEKDLSNINFDDLDLDNL